MLAWLDGLGSIADAPNENFARELWELFMLGEGQGYTEADIKEASRAFTGFRRQRNDATLGYDTVVYVEANHDPASKTIFGVSGRFGYDDNLAFDTRDTDGGIVDLTLRERGAGAARHLARKLLSFLVYVDPPEAVVEDLAAGLRDGLPRGSVRVATFPALSYVSCVSRSSPDGSTSIFCSRSELVPLAK